MTGIGTGKIWKNCTVEKLKAKVEELSLEGIGKKPALYFW